MYYYNPYFSFAPMVQRGSIFKNLFANINFSSILNGTQKTLNIINQAIPVVKQVSPILKNGKTMFKLMSEFNKPDNGEKIVNNINEVENKHIYSNDGEPTFFI